MKLSEKLSKEQIEYIANCCHNTNKFYCEALGDYSQPEYVDAPEEIQKSAINGVMYVLDNQNATSSNKHESWMKEKIENGWVYGEVKDTEKKTHPCLVLYEELPVSHQFKYYLFKLAAVNALVTLTRKE